MKISVIDVMLEEEYEDVPMSEIDVELRLGARKLYIHNLDC